MRGEDGAEYEKLRKDVYHRWQPEGPMEERIADQIVSHVWRLGRADRAERAFLDGLVTRAAGYRSCEIEHDVQLIGGKLRVREKEKEEMILEGAKDIEVTPEDIESALGASVSDARAMKASRLLVTNRRSTLRGIRRCEEQLKALHRQRFLNPPPDFENEAEPPLRPSTTYGWSAQIPHSRRRAERRGCTNAKTQKQSQKSQLFKGGRFPSWDLSSRIGRAAAQDAREAANGWTRE